MPEWETKSSAKIFQLPLMTIVNIFSAPDNDKVSIIYINVQTSVEGICFKFCHSYVSASGSKMEMCLVFRGHEVCGTMG
jgi:hypothetical protein